RWVASHLAAARAAPAPAQVVALALGALEVFGQGADISRQPFAVRDDYTSLMWLGGTSALNTLRDVESASQLFWRYATAARTPMTRAKG
ncbi:hypothetical protein NL474_28510, partial [Klebsiella pneumoniae]|nr:hypothetical protein [Klebsiella pneumoniae]